MGTQGPGRKRIANRERLSAEDDALNLIAREAEARLAAKRAARAEAREIRMKELERQQKEIYQVQKKYYGLDSKFGDIEQWMEDSEKYSRRFRRHTSVSDEDDWTSVGSRGSTRTGYESIGACAVVAEKSRKKKKKQKAANGFDELSCGSGPSKQSSRGSCYSDLPLYSTGPSSKSHTASQNGTRVEERLEKDFTEKSSRAASSLSAATLASLGGTSSRRGSGETTTSMDTEGSIREIKDSLAEVEEKYKKAMVSNAQLDNEKTNFMYQVDTLRESLLELEEQLAETHRMHEEKTKELDRQKHAYSILQHQFETMKETLKEREEMLTEIKGLNQKLISSTQEISDLQETLEWKDKKIGALERQKEYSDAIRIDRDELREEVAMLKERLKAYGLLTNGEAEPVRKDGNTYMEAAETGPQAGTQLQSSSDGPLGEGHVLQMRNEILETVGQRGVLQNTGIDEQMEETGNREMLMNNVQEKDVNEEYDELTEGEAPAMTVRDNGDADQIERAAANLDDGKQSACDTQSLGGKEVSEEIWHALGSGGGIQCYGSMEESESESDLGVNEKHMQENVKQKLDHDERSQTEVGDPRSHEEMRKENYPEFRNDIDVLCNDSADTEADDQTIVEETQKVVQQVLENAIETLQQDMCGCDLQEESRNEEKEVTQEGVGSIQRREDNLTGMQEQSAEVVHVGEKELDDTMSKEMGEERVVMRDIGFHPATNGSEICTGNLNNELGTASEETGCVLDIAIGQNEKSKSSGGDMDLMVSSVQDEVKNGEGREELVGTTFVQLEKEVEEIAEKTEIGNYTLTQTDQQEVELGEKVTCHLIGARSPIVDDEVKQPFSHNEEWKGEPTVIGKAEGELQAEVKDLGLEEEPIIDEVKSGPGVEEVDRTTQVVLQGKVEGNLEPSCLQEMTLIGEVNKAAVEVENQAIGDDKSYQGDEVKWHEEDEENIQDTGEARSQRKNGDMIIKNQDDEREIKGLSPDEGKGHEGDKEEEIEQGKDREVESPRNYEDEIKGIKCNEIRSQGEKEDETDDSAGLNEIEDCEEVVPVPGIVNSEFREKRGESESSSARESGEEEGEVKVPIEEEGEVKGLTEEGGEVKDPQEMEDNEARGPVEEDEVRVQGPQEENGKVKDTREEDNAKGLREEDSVDQHSEVEDKAKGFREEMLKSHQECKEVEIICTKAEKDNVQATRKDEFKGPLEELEDGVKDPREEKTRHPSEGMMDEVILPKEVEKAKDVIEVVGVVSVTEDEDEVQCELKGEKLLCTNVKGTVQEMGKEVSLGEESEGVFPNLRTTKKERDEMEEKMGFQQTECNLSGQASAVVQEIDQGKQTQNEEETNKGKSETNTEGVYEVMDSKGDQGTPIKEEATITEEITAKESLSVSNGEEVRQVKEYSSDKKFEGDTQLSEGFVSDLVENNERERLELNEKSEEVAQGNVKQDSLKNAMVLDNVIDQGETQSSSANEHMVCDEEEGKVESLIEEESEVKGSQEFEGDAAKEDRTEMQDRKREDMVNEERDMSVSDMKPQHKTPGCKSTKDGADNAPVSQTGVEKEQDDEKRDGFECNEAMNEILGDETQDRKEVLEVEMERGEVDSGSETGPKPNMSTEPNEQINPIVDNTGARMPIQYKQEGEQGEQRNESTISNDQQSKHSGESPQDNRQSIKSDMSTWDDKEMEQNPEMAETGKDSKRKSKTKDDCLLS
ncbi:myb-like protein X isoform X3 [Hemiscyllium ocellatum]|uniref:myb-like protein X isoform X3 n=1 Tax=Hemiscyllium ocellatum TaxID=170820 RepID=UPI0029660296|nr:myb-like protein X isoform X3 [Hemiscyllium ocellatum]